MYIIYSKVSANYIQMFWKTYFVTKPNWVIKKVDGLIFKLMYVHGL